MLRYVYLGNGGNLLFIGTVRGQSVRVVRLMGADRCSRLPSTRFRGALNMSRAEPYPDRDWFAVNTGRVDADYLAFLAERVPKDLVKQLYEDALPDIYLDRRPPETLVEPLSSGVFPQDEKERWEIENLLRYVTWNYDTSERWGEYEDPFKIVYSMSLYLHCYILGYKDPPPNPYLTALRLLVTAAGKLDFQTRLQVCRFLGSRITMLPPDPNDCVGAVSGLVWAIAVLLGSLVENVAAFGEVIANEENIKEKWHKGEEYMDPERVKKIEQLLREMYGAQGRVLRAADQLVSALGGPDNPETRNDDTGS
ncbi:hypothetical protein THTE_2977 [Thermogutta terrifontis]|uniref:Uncharacterized protein n=2 Tax=Thermogutta terrifontis TaxID=1331910 RepID=A0A286RHZ3_9BACT|nr:hypothetical protein THTE_2977 [Thermogutta terrifontis]